MKWMVRSLLVNGEFPEAQSDPATPPIHTELIKLLSREDGGHQDHTNVWFPELNSRIRIALKVIVLMCRGIIDPLPWDTWTGNAGLWLALLMPNPREVLPLALARMSSKDTHYRRWLTAHGEDDMIDMLLEEDPCWTTPTGDCILQ
jgi:hypothetical protein